MSNLTQSNILYVSACAFATVHRNNLFRLCLGPKSGRLAIFEKGVLNLTNVPMLVN